ncbi:CU044_2847 family protein [Asanoa hainanensis]|uniref:CU044_2847 family protein n=1 Tax=Asanoa hainanensis TaxID=560556 RepID=UPI000B7702AA|nr:CU044_2847 family protein [Asanoa hainanensis]
MRLSSGGQIWVDVGEEHGVVRVGTSAGEALAKAASSVVEVFDDIRDTADDALRTMIAMESAPSKIEIVFGVTVTAEANAVIAKAGAQANMTVTVAWERNPGGES